MQHQQLEPRLPVTPRLPSLPSPSPPLLACCVACRERERLLAVNVDDAPQPDLPRRSRTVPLPVAATLDADEREQTRGVACTKRGGGAGGEEIV